MLKRRRFIGGFGLGIPALLSLVNSNKRATNSPVVVSTWAPNTKANKVAFECLKKGLGALDAVHEGIKVPEADPKDQSVGYGGLPDREGKVTVDACIMDHLGNCGAVMALENILHPISVAKMVMEKTPHVQLAGQGAFQFAVEMGFKPQNLLTQAAEAAWKKWLKEAKYNPNTTVENILETIKNQHDTIGMLALGNDGNLAGGCSTSGMAYKLRGRVGDSPIIGSGLYVDNEVGAATGTGVGEEIVRICGSHTVVEYMRQGFSPEESCKKTLERLVKLRGKEKLKTIQIGLIALDVQGNLGCYALNKDFTMAVTTEKGSKVMEAKHLF